MFQELERLSQHISRQQNAVGSIRGKALEELENWRQGARAQRIAVVCHLGLRAGGYLIDPEYLGERTAALIAQEGSWAGCAIGIDSDLTWAVEQAIAEILSEDEVCLAEGSLTLASRFEFLTRPFGLPAGQGLRSSVRFHRLSRPTRLVFQALVSDRCTFEQCEAQGLGTQEELLQAVRYGLKAVLLLENHWPELEVLG
ncbi:MAG: hypothetical protein R3F17_14845 [Planctomycetota bacterium]